jgi:hypothetical protein
MGLSLAIYNKTMGGKTRQFELTVLSHLSVPNCKINYKRQVCKKQANLAIFFLLCVVRARAPLNFFFF